MPVVRFSVISLICQDLAASVAFYRRIGLDVPDSVQGHIEITIDGGPALELDSVEVTHLYDKGWTPAGDGSRVILGFSCESRPEVDALYAALLAAGDRGYLSPHDAFWGERYAEVLDPDGNIVGFHSPRDASLAFNPMATT